MLGSDIDASALRGCSSNHRQTNATTMAPMLTQWGFQAVTLFPIGQRIPEGEDCESVIDPAQVRSFILETKLTSASPTIFKRHESDQIP
jgi:hypothetical protein